MILSLLNAKTEQATSGRWLFLVEKGKMKKGIKQKGEWKEEGRKIVFSSRVYYVETAGVSLGKGFLTSRMFLIAKIKIYILILYKLNDFIML